MTTEMWSAVAAIAAAVAAIVSAVVAVWQAPSIAKSATEARRARELQQQELEEARPGLRVRVSEVRDFRPGKRADLPRTVVVTNKSKSRDVTFDQAGVMGVGPSFGYPDRPLDKDLHSGWRLSGDARPQPLSLVLVPGERCHCDLTRDMLTGHLDAQEELRHEPGMEDLNDAPELRELVDDRGRLHLVVYAWSTAFDVPHSDDLREYSNTFMVQM
ncbi:MAG: hypothetical protein ACRDOY_07845 [Nocardioidaceae bacterium]